MQKKVDLGGRSSAKLHDTYRPILWAAFSGHLECPPYSADPREIQDEEQREETLFG